MAVFAAAFGACAAAFGEIQIIDGVAYECKDGMCMPVDMDAAAKPAAVAVEKVKPVLGLGYMDADDFIAFLDGKTAEKGMFDGMPLWLMLLAVLAGGFCLNLTPCVLPMMPVTLMIIGRSSARGLLYGLGLALAYGALGVAASMFGLSFGAIQGDPWFNTAVAAIFFLFALAMSGAFFIDFSGKKNNLARLGGKMAPGLFAFFMGLVGAVLAGACVAPVLLAVLAQSAVMASSGQKVLAVALPFVLGAGMALPWPFAAAGMKVLPKPGAWMKYVNYVFAAVVLCFALWYAHLAWNGFSRGGAAPETPRTAGDAAADAAFTVVEVDSPEKFSLEGLKRPVLVDCWASWCKNCTAMEKTTFHDPRVKAKLAGWTVVRLRAEDIRKLKATPGFEDAIGLPAFAIYK